MNRIAEDYSLQNIKILKRYDKTGMLIGEAPCMKKLSIITLKMDLKWCWIRNR